MIFDRFKASNKNETAPAGSDGFSGREIARQLLAETTQPPAAPERSPEEITAIAGNLLGDFAASFALSQGSESAQTNLLLMLANQYRQDYDVSTVSQALSQAETSLSRLKMPGRHTPTMEINGEAKAITPDAAASGFEGEWQKFIKNGVVADSPRMLQPEFYGQITDTALRGILYQELKFQAQGRPVRADGDDAYGSPIRERIISGNFQGSPQRHRVLSDLASHAQEERPSRSTEYTVAVGGMLDELRAQWEKHHPGASFFLEDEPAA